MCTLFYDFILVVLFSITTTHWNWIISTTISSSYVLLEMVIFCKIDGVRYVLSAGNIYILSTNV